MKNIEEPAKKRTIKINLTNETIINSFLNAIQEVESMREFYETFRDAWIKNKHEFEDTYKVGLEINAFIEKLLGSNTPMQDYQLQKNTIIQGYMLDEMIKINITEKENKITISYSMQDAFSTSSIYNPQISRKKYLKIENQKEIFVRSILSNFVIIFERYFSKIYEFMVVLNPESYLEGKTIKLSDLFSLTSAQLIHKEVRKQVADKMYDSLSTLENMKNKSNFNIDRYLPIQKEFEEIYFRRNIFIHNSGVVNDSYLSSVDDKYSSRLKCGDKLDCDNEYMKNAITTLKKMICILFYEFLLATKPDIECYNALSDDVAFSALSNGEYPFAEYIYGVLSKNKYIEYAEKTRCQVNYMIALKQQGKSIETLLAHFDVSAMDVQFNIAKNCLLDNHDKVYDLLSEVCPQKIPAVAIRDWPLFIDFRKTQRYEQFKSEHADDFKQFVFEDKANAEDTAEDAAEDTLSIDLPKMRCSVK